MAVNYPTSLDTTTNLPNPASTDLMENVTAELDHDYQHDTINDIVRAIEAKLGIDGSAVTGSVDYKLRKGSFIRATAALTTSALASGTSDAAQTLSVGKAGMAIHVATDFPCWVRIYSTANHQSADSGRTQSTDPTGEHGVLLEFATIGGALTIDLAPSAWLYSLEGSPLTTLSVTVVNNDTVSRTITVTLTYVPMEG